MGDPVADRVDTAVDAVQSTPDPIVDRPSADPRPRKLPSSYHPVLPARELGQQPIHLTSAAFAPNKLANAALALESHGPMLDRRGARVVR
jgi:hypothetical protein